MITPPLPIACISSAMLLALIGCSSESSTPETNNIVSNITLQDEDFGGNQVITDFVGRDITLATLRALHIVRDYEAWLENPQAAPQSSNSEACNKGGNKQLQVTNEDNEFGTAGDRVSIVYEQCTEPTPAGDQFYTGDLGITFENDATTISINSLRVKGPGTSEILIQGLVATTAQTGSSTGTTLDLTADFPELNITGVSISTPSALLGDNISCPSDGELLIVASDGAQSRVSDFSGENMLVTISGGNPYTLACSEINPPSIEPPINP